MKAEGKAEPKELIGEKGRLVLFWLFTFIAGANLFGAGMNFRAGGEGWIQGVAVAVSLSVSACIIRPGTRRRG